MAVVDRLAEPAGREAAPADERLVAVDAVDRRRRRSARRAAAARPPRRSRGPRGGGAPAAYASSKRCSRPRATSRTTVRTRHQRHREGRAEGVVADLEELVGDHVADHQRLVAAEDRGDRVLAGRRARRRGCSRRRSPAPPAAGRHGGTRRWPAAPRSEAAAEQRRIDPLERDEQRQDHQRQVAVDDADRDRRRRIQDLRRVARQMQPAEEVARAVRRRRAGCTSA